VLAIVVGAVLFVELVLFNLPFLNTWTLDERVIGPDQTTLVDVSYVPEVQLFQATEAHGVIDITGLDQPIRSLYVRPQFRGPGHTQTMKIGYADEDASERDAGTFQLIDGAPGSSYVSLILNGDVRRITLTFDSSEIEADLAEIVLNRTVPFQFNAIRCLLLLALAGGAVVFMRTKAWRIRCDPGSTGQSVVTWAALAGFIAFLVAGAVLSQEPDRGLSLLTTGTGHYSRLVEALLHGQVSLLETPDPRLVAADNPYDITFRHAEGIPYPWDTAYYDGHYYIYFGIVPALLFFLPFTAATGEFLNPVVLELVAVAAASVFAVLFWTRFTRRFWPRWPYVLFLASLGTLLGCSQLGFLIWRPDDMALAIAMAEAFVFAGLWLAVRGAGDGLTGPRPRALIGAAACLALAVGCRPTALLVSVLFLFFLWDALRPAPVLEPAGDLDPAGDQDNEVDDDSRGPEKLLDSRAGTPPERRWRAWLEQHWRTLMGVAIPYVIVGVGLMIYNYIRFDSILEFGASYQLTVSNIASFGDISPIGKLVKAGYGAFAYFGNTIDFRLTFPFIDVPLGVNFDGFHGSYYQIQPIGLVSLPSMWLLAATVAAVRSFRRHGQPLVARLIIVTLAVGLVLTVAESLLGGIMPRYQADFLWLFQFAAVCSAAAIFAACDRHDFHVGPVVGALCTLLTATTLIMTLFAVTGYANLIAERRPALYFALTDFWRLW
jgi:hypothetical protein